jgi:hypothetical protein
LYVDGQLQTSPIKQQDFTVNSLFNSSASVMIGTYASLADYFTGSIDDVRVYNRVLSAAEIAQLYKQGSVNAAHSPSASSGQPAPLGAGLIGYWTMDGPSINWATGKMTDASGQGNTGQLVSMSTTTSPVTGKIGQALNFNGSTSYISLDSSANNIEGRNAGTFSAWFKTSAPAHGTSEDQILFTLNDTTNSTSNQMQVEVGENTGSYSDESIGFIVQRDSATQLRMQVRRGSSFFKDGKWHQVVVATGNGANTIYVDGVDQAPYITFQAGSASTNEFSNISNQNGMRIGGENRGGTFFGAFTGSIDDVRVYNRALSASEVKQLYTMGK